MLDVRFIGLEVFCGVVLKKRFGSLELRKDLEKGEGKGADSEAGLPGS